MQKLAILNSREIKKIREKVIQQFGYFPQGDYAFLKNNNERLFIVNKDLDRINLNNLKIDRIGLYFAELMNDSSVRLSKEGAQFLSQEAHKNHAKLQHVIELTYAEVKEYFLGSDLDRDLGEPKFILLSFNKDILGCTKYRQGKILNFLPKIHRGEVIV